MKAWRRARHEFIVPISRAANKAKVFYNKHKKKPLVIAGLWILTNIITYGAGALKPVLAEWYVRHSDNQHALGIFMLGWRTNQPHCSISVFSLATGDEIKSLHISLTFDQPIVKTISLRGYSRKGDDVTIDTSASTPKDVGPPCDVKTESTEKDERLSIATSADHRQVFIDGHDITLADTQTFMIVLYPDKTIGAETRQIQWSADGSYERFGYEMPIKYSFNAAPAGATKSVHLFDTNEHLVKLPQ